MQYTVVPATKKIYFKCKTNYQYCRIDKAVFRNKNTGDKIYIDRDKTIYSVDSSNIEEDYILNMIWDNYYLWNGKDKNYMYGLYDHEFVEFILEDESEEDYYIELISITI